MRLIDISPPISPALAVWPGDTPSSREILADMATGDNLTLSTHRATVHLGSHADAPSHYVVDGDSIDRADLRRYIGPCQVVSVDVDRGARADPDHLAAVVTEPRVLVRTGSFPNPRSFNEDFSALSPKLVSHLAAGGVKLLGIDTPSVDLFDSKELPSHLACAKHDVRILEGLVLHDVADGIYELIALPLALVGFDASPVRAVLCELD
ncbi:MAG: cyclase family protein [Gemmatimonadales bacterium]